MRPGIKTEEIVVGSGDEAVRGKTVVVSVRMFLNHGTELTDMGGKRLLINLDRRDCIAGLRYGIEGMRVGGQRKITISPHLAYGTDGVPGRVPPNAVIHCEAELIGVREHGVFDPEDYPPGRHVYVFSPGVAASSRPRWQFGLEEDGRCGITITYPIPGMSWRHTRQSHIQVQLDTDTIHELFDDVYKLQELYPADCFQIDDVWSDMTERGNGITRHRESNTLCLSISVIERGQHLISFYLAETSCAMQQSALMKLIRDLLDNNLEQAR